MIGSCNSNKCHCPRCRMAKLAAPDLVIPARGLPYFTDDALLEGLPYFADDALLEALVAYRRERWKRLARQHHIDRAGVCCAQYRPCSCPNCVGPSAAPKVEGTKFFRWTWINVRGGWQRWDMHANRLFGIVVRHVEPRQRRAVHYSKTRTVGGASIREEKIVYESNPGGGEGLKSKFTSRDAVTAQAHEYFCRYYWGDLDNFDDDDPPPAYVSMSDAVQYYRRFCLSSPKVRAAFVHGDWAEKKKEHPVLTTLQLAVLSHYRAHPTLSYPSASIEAVNARNWLVSQELLEHSVHQPGYAVADRGMVFLDAVYGLSLPVRKTPPWTMPT